MKLKALCRLNILDCLAINTLTFSDLADGFFPQKLTNEAEDNQNKQSKLE